MIPVDVDDSDEEMRSIDSSGERVHEDHDNVSVRLLGCAMVYDCLCACHAKVTPVRVDAGPEVTRAIPSMTMLVDDGTTGSSVEAPPDSGTSESKRAPRVVPRLYDPNWKMPTELKELLARNSASPPWKCEPVASGSRARSSGSQRELNSALISLRFC